MHQLKGALMHTEGNEPLTYKVDEVARLLGIGRNHCYEACKRGDIPTIRVGKRLLIPRVALDRMLNGGKAA
jgi:excisionase family DNA binding protein